MPYVPPELKERIKREISIQRLAEARGVKLRRVGRNMMGLCPFHKDTSPSLSITPETNTWNCLGACNKGGDVIEWVKYAEGVSFTHAVELLKRDWLPASTRSGGPPPKQSTVPKLPPLIRQTNDDKKLLLTVVEFYHQTLKESPEAQQYLQKRGLMNAEMVEHFQLGFSNRSLAYVVPASNRAAGEEQRGRLKQLGILKKDTGHEHFRGSLVIPVLDLNGEVAQIYGRKITPSSRLRDDTPEHLYLPGPQRGVWNENALAVSKEIILCEALLDALTFWCAGFRHVTTCYGVNGFNDELRAAFQRYGTKRIYIAYDRDEAGERAAQKHSEELIEMGIECFRVQFPRNMDANEYAQKVTPAPKSLGVLLNRAEWLGKGKRPVVSVPTMPTTQPPPIEKIEEEKPEAAAKEENAISLPTQSLTESVLPLAADVEVHVPLPAATALPLDISTLTKSNGLIEITLGQRLYTVRGLKKNTSHEVLKVTVTVAGANLRGETGEHTDTLDFYSARQRAAFLKQAAEELGVKEEALRSELGKTRMQLEALRDEQIEKTLEQPKGAVEITATDRAAALELLCDPRLLERVLEDFARCSVVGEETNKQLGYLAAVSRLLDAPLAVIVQSSSAAGKSLLMEAVLAFMPEERRVQYSAMTGQALFYMGETDLQHKILAVVEEEGAQRASYALKLLQSEAALTIASTGKDPNSGRLITHEYRVQGPVMIFLTTTKIDVDEELLNRCLVLTVNEDRAQTQAIHRVQRTAQTLEGLLRKEERAAIVELHRNAQRLLRSVRVVNPYADDLTFPDNLTRTRRDHMKFLTLINAITLLYQYQRPLKTAEGHGGRRIEYIESTREDIALASRLAPEVLGHSLDELPPQTRKLLLLVDGMVKRACEEQKIERSEFRFSRRDVRTHTCWGDTQLKIHLHRLEELEYLIVHRGGRGQSFVYELIELPEGDQSQPFLPGLTVVEKLKIHTYDANPSGSDAEKSGPSRPQVGTVSGSGRSEEARMNTEQNNGFSQNHGKSTTRENATGNPAVPPALMKKPNGAARAAAGVK